MAAIALALGFAVHDALGLRSFSAFTYTPYDRAFALGHIIVLSIAALLVWKRPAEPAVLAFVAGLVGTACNVLWNFGYPEGPWFWIAMLLDYVGTALGLLFLLRFSALYAAGDATPVSRGIALSAPVLALWVGVSGLLVPALAFGVPSFAGPAYDTTAYWLSNAHWAGVAAGMLCILAAAFSQYRAAPVGLRQRCLLVLAGVSVFATAEFVQATLRILTQRDDPAGNAVSVGGLALMSLILGYALLTRNLFDVELIVDRTIVLALTTLALSALVYAAEEFVAPVIVKFAENLTHAEERGRNLALAIELAVGFPFFLVMHKIYDAAFELVQRYSTASRDKGLRTLRTFRRAIVSLPDDETLERNLVRTLVAMGASSARFYRTQGDREKLVRSAGDLAEHAPRIDARLTHALRSRGEPVLVPQAADSAGSGRPSLVLPMLVRGDLYGIVAMGPKRSGAPYGGDEIEELSGAVLEAGLAHRALSRSAAPRT